MPGSSPATRRRRDDPARPHVFRIDPPQSIADRYDPAKDLPKCPDGSPSGEWELSGRLWEGRFREGRLVDHRSRFYPSRGALQGQVRALREAVPELSRQHFGERRLVKLREGAEPTDWWSYGLNTPPFGGGLTTPYVPLIPGPATRQLYWADYFAMSAKAFEASNHNPIAKRAVEIGVDFTLGRGIEHVAKTDRGQATWDAFWKRNNMDERLEEILGDLTVYGEIFVRYFKPVMAKGLIVRSLDPAGIYDIISDQEDWESVYFYHQQEQERQQLFAPPAGDLAPQGPTSPDAVTKYTIRQIPGEEIDHYRINVRSGEARGRSDLFSALGYLKRLQDLLTSKVVRADMQSRMVFDLMVEGNASDVRAVKGELFPGNRPPEPGTVIGHNKHAELNAFEFAAGNQGVADTTVEEIVTMCALGTGVSRQWIWESAHGGGARAGALVATEPGQKRFERRQRLAQRILHAMADREFAECGLTGEDAEIEFIFPSIAVEERSAALKDIAFAESSGWISRETAATMSARQLDIETFDFDDEQEKIAEEFDDAQEDEGDDEDAVEPTFNADGSVKDPGSPAKPATPKQGDGKIRRPMVNAAYRQVPKLDPTKSATAEDQPPGLLMPGAGEAAAGPGAPPAVGSPQDAGGPGRAGIPGDENVATQAGKAKVRADSGGGGGAKVRESADMVPAEVHERMMTVALREAALAGARVPRRRPDDPEFVAASDHYRDESRSNIRRLVETLNGSAARRRREHDR